jgi:hypothetical protein
MSVEIVAPPANLAACEQIIERGLRSFTEVGIALITIRDGRLYRASYPTFEAYCADRWGFSRPRAYELINATEVHRALSAMADTPVPENERQARQLNGLEPEQAAEVMHEAHQATNGKPTAASIAEARQKLLPPVAKITETETTKTESYVDTATGEILDPPTVDPQAEERRRERAAEDEAEYWRENARRQWNEFLIRALEFFAFDGSRFGDYDPDKHRTKPATSEMFDQAADGLAQLRKDLSL